MKAETVSNLIAFAALALSFLAIWLSYRANRKIVGIEKGRDEREKTEAESALLTGYLEKGEPSTTFLCIENIGASQATNISLAFENSRNHPMMAEPNLMDVGLVDGNWHLGSRAHVKIPIERDFRTELPRNLKITWTDGRGSGNEWSSALGQPR